MEMDISSIDRDTLAHTPLDLASYVVEVNRFSALLGPLAQIYLDIHDIRRWRSPNVSLGFLILLNLGGLIFSRGAVFVLACTLIFLVSAVCVFHVHTRILDKVLPETQYNREESLVLDDVADDCMKEVKDFRVSLIQVYILLMRVNRSLTRFYALAKWDDFASSFRFYVTGAVFLLACAIFPARWNFLFFTNWFLLSHKRVEKYIKWLYSRLQNKIKGDAEPKITISPDAEVTEKATEQVTDMSENNGHVKEEIPESEETSPKHVKHRPPLSEADLESDSSDSDAVYPTSTSGESTPKRGVVSRLLDFKRRKQQMMTGNCHGCQSSFTSILKRRHYCRHCGNHFCAKCCSQKVPRSVFGATSPAAQTETVLVCASCNNQLVAKGLKIL